MIMLTMRPVALLLLLGATLGLSAAQDPCFCVKQVPLTDGKTSPTVLANAGDESGRLFYGEQNGKVWVWQKNGDGDWEELPEPFVDLSDFILVGGEQGFLSLEFHPDHANNGLLYMYYSYSTTEGDRVTLLTEVSVEDDNPNRVDISSERQLLQIPQPFPNHNGGDVRTLCSY